MSNIPAATAGAKMLFLIKRKPATSREELVAHWFANHMPGVIESQQQNKAANRLHAWRYIATLFDADKSGLHPWDGIAQLWWDRPLPKPQQPFGDPARDTFQAKAEPYWPWATREYVVMDADLPAAPNTLNEPFPMTRSGFLKITFLVAARDGIDHDAFFKHWLEVHVPNVTSVMQQVGGTRYVVSHSLQPADETFAGMAELYFPDADGWRQYRQTIQPDGMEAYAADQGTLVLRAHTEMVGIP